ncbi:SRP72 domain-containing protein [Mycena chlorophos]|uniref:Signal recognition particle subunit SRP72 n=1 Tax=Mycena chlorophos TaxID=658473 RepID=A0A8H6SJ29_MYCCL|nr:SRP72 domain-containing protein [Mycena chlorophos]
MGHVPAHCKSVTPTQMPPKTAPTRKSSKHVSKPKTKAPLSEAEQVKRLFKTLCAQIDGGHHTSALKTCDKILRLLPGDTDALKTKLFLLLTTDQPKAALALIDTLGGEKENAFEQAYALYSLHQREEAKKLLEGTEERGAKHLEAQLNYREGAYQTTLDIYNDLLDSAPTAEEHTDILTNIQAASTHLDFINTGFLAGLSSVPAAQLEDAPPPAASAAPVASTSSPTAPAKPKAAKKVKLPPGVVLGVTPPPDPERWLKKSERSTFNAGKRRKGAGGGATQGSSVDAPSAGASSTGGGGKKGGKKRK